MNDKTYLYGIDLVRFAAALSVCLFHFSWLEPGLSATAWFGWIGVQIFFVISGFVIARSANNTTPLKFVESRFFRLYPTAWICASVSFALICAFGSDRLNGGLVAGYAASLVLFPTGPFIGSAYWTLPIEITFYLLILFVLLIERFHQIERVATLLGLASAAYIVAYTLQRAGFTGDAGLEFGYKWKNITLLRHGIYFAFGIFLCLWSEGLLTRAGAMGWAASLCAAPLEITCRTAELVPQMPAPLDPWKVWWIPVAIWAGSCGLLAASSRWRRALASLPPPLLHAIRLAGLSTYPLYLIHEELGMQLKRAASFLGFSKEFGLMVALTGAIGAALVVARLVEPPLRAAVRERLPVFGALGRSGRMLQRLQQSGGKL